MMNTTRHIAGALAVIFLATTFSIGCGPGEKSRELTDLERTLQDPGASEVKDAPGASKPYREARQFRRLSLEAWDEGEDQLSREYAILGTLRYRTAAAIKEQVEAKERLDKANAQVTDTNPEIKALDQEISKLMTEVATLERQVKTQQRRDKAQNQQESFQTGTQNEDARKLAINNRINDVEAAKRAAEQVNAQKHAAGAYNKANNVLKSVRTLVSSGQVGEDTMQQANQALQLFKTAAEEARPGYQEEVAKANPEERRAALRSEATRAFGAEQVITESRGARIVLPSLFPQGSASMDPGMSAQVEQLAKLAEKYDEFNIFVEGYTSKRGSATENLGTSQLRANAVRRALTGAGIQSGRIETRGFGQERPRFSSDSRNERVEVVMTRAD